MPRTSSTPTTHGSHRPAVVTVRLVCPPEVLDAALSTLGDLLGDAWQPSTRKPSRYAGGEIVQYGTLIVPVPTDPNQESSR